MSVPEYTTGQLMTGIAAAIRDGDLGAAGGLLTLLEARDPEQAVAAREALEAARAQAGEPGDAARLLD